MILYVTYGFIANISRFIDAIRIQQSAQRRGTHTGNQIVVMIFIIFVVKIGIFIYIDIYFLRLVAIRQRRVRRNASIVKSCPFFFIIIVAANKRASVIGNFFVLIGDFRIGLDAPELHFYLRAAVIIAILVTVQIKMRYVYKPVMSVLRQGGNRHRRTDAYHYH